jgi:hypothetical protein
MENTHNLACELLKQLYTIVTSFLKKKERKKDHHVGSPPNTVVEGSLFRQEVTISPLKC